MRILQNALLPSLLAAALTLSGCSTTQSENDFQAQPPADSAQVKVESQETESGLSAQAGGRSQTAKLSEETEKTKPKNPEPQTVMYLEPGVDRIWQNGPSPEERRQVNKLRPRKPRRGVEDGSSSPVLDTTGLVLIEQ